MLPTIRPLALIAAFASSNSMPTTSGTSKADELLGAQRVRQLFEEEAEVGLREGLRQVVVTFEPRSLRDISEEVVDGGNTFTHDGDYIIYTTADKEDYSGYSVFMFIRDAVGDYYGMNSTLMNGYIAGLQNFGFENKYLNIDMEKGEYKIYSASKWDMKELDEMYVNDTALEYSEALTEDDVNRIINSGKITVVTYGNKDHFKMFVYEYGDKNTDLTYKSIMAVMNKFQPTDYELFNKYYTELQEVKDADGFSVTFGLDKSMEEAGEITGLDDYSCVTIIYNASK